MTSFCNITITMFTISLIELKNSLIIPKIIFFFDVWKYTSLITRLTERTTEHRCDTLTQGRLRGEAGRGTLAMTAATKE